MFVVGLPWCICKRLFEAILPCERFQGSRHNVNLQIGAEVRELRGSFHLPKVQVWSYLFTQRHT